MLWIGRARTLIYIGMIMSQWWWCTCDLFFTCDCSALKIHDFLLFFCLTFVNYFVIYLFFFFSLSYCISIDLSLRFPLITCQQWNVQLLNEHWTGNIQNKTQRDRENKKKRTKNVNTIIEGIGCNEHNHRFFFCTNNK